MQQLELFPQSRSEHPQQQRDLSMQLAFQTTYDPCKPEGRTQQVRDDDSGDDDCDD